MAVTTTTARQSGTRSASPTSKDDAAPTEQTAAEAGSDMLQTISRMIYSGSYALAYGVVYATCSLPSRCLKRIRSCTGFATVGRQQWTSSAGADLRA
jgi:hypothetical protein